MEEKERKSKSGLNGNTIKLIACISMVIDHITYVFIPPESDPGWMGENPWYLLGRGLGRPAFILLTFLLVEGFFYSKDRRTYIIRLLIAALISEPVYDTMCGNLSLYHFLDLQNVLFQFALGIFIISLLEAVRLKYFLSSKLYYNIFAVLVCLLGFAAAYYFRVDYGIVGMALILIFYFMHDAKRSKLAVAVAIWSIACMFMSYMLEWVGLPAMVLICRYNGERGRDIRWFFYAFYPLHMLIIILIRYMVV